MRGGPLPVDVSGAVEVIEHSLTLEFKRVLAEEEWRAVVEQVRTHVPHVQHLHAHYMEAENMGYRPEGNAVEGESVDRRTSLNRLSDHGGPMPKLAVPTAIAELELEVCSLRENIAKLRGRLSSVLEPPHTTNEPSETAPKRSGVSGAIVEVAADVRQTNSELRELLARLEV